MENDSFFSFQERCWFHWSPQRSHTSHFAKFLTNCSGIYHAEQRWALTSLGGFAQHTVASNCKLDIVSASPFFFPSHCTVLYQYIIIQFGFISFLIELSSARHVSRVPIRSKPDECILYSLHSKHALDLEFPDPFLLFPLSAGSFYFCICIIET